MKRRTLFLSLLLGGPFVASAQSIWLRNTTTTPPTVQLGSLGDFVSIGSATRTFSGNKFEVVSGGVMFRSTAGGMVRFENPNGEEGLSVHTTSSRADFRVDANSLKIGFHGTTGVVPASNLMYVTAAGNFGIGVSPAASTTAKMELQSASDFGFKSINSKTSTIASLTPVSIYGEAMGSVGMGYGGTFKGGHVGVYGEVQQNLDNLLPEQKGSAVFDITGVSGYAGNGGLMNSRSAVGVRGEGYCLSQTGNSYGLWGYASGSGIAVGVIADASGSAGSYAGYFIGNVVATGTFTTTSDRKLKKNIETLPDALEKVMMLRPTTYEFKRDEYDQMRLPEGKRFGFIAQELEQVLPLLVSKAYHPETKDKDGNITKEAVDFKSVNYIELIPLLTKAIQEQQKQILNQQEKIEHLQKMLTEQSAATTGVASAEPLHETGFLGQNEPNPFTQNTSINYQLPQGTQAASIGIYDLNGKEVKLFALGKEAKGTISIDGASMQPGIYIYTLLINGAPYDTKKMVFTSR